MMTKTGTLAIRAMIVLAELPGEKYVGAAQVAKKLKAPPNYLSKLLQSLCKTDIVVSQKGMGGGFRLARDPEKISLYEVIEPLEQVSRWERCIMGRATCSDENPCVLHQEWAAISGRYLDLLENTTISDLIRGYKKVKI